MVSLLRHSAQHHTIIVMQVICACSIHLVEIRPVGDTVCIAQVCTSDERIAVPKSRSEYRTNTFYFHAEYFTRCRVQDALVHPGLACLALITKPYVMKLYWCIRHRRKEQNAIFR